MYKRIVTQEVKFPENPKISPECKNFIASLLRKDPSKRLGSQADVLELMDHEFFKGLNWFQLYAKEIEPVYRPFEKGKSWLDNFGSIFVSQQLTDSIGYANPL